MSERLAQIPTAARRRKKEMQSERIISGLCYALGILIIIVFGSRIAVGGRGREQGLLGQSVTFTCIVLRWRGPRDARGTWARRERDQPQSFYQRTVRINDTSGVWY